MLSILFAIWDRWTVFCWCLKPTSSAGAMFNEQVTTSLEPSEASYASMDIELSVWSSFWQKLKCILSESSAQGSKMAEWRPFWVYWKDAKRRPGLGCLSLISNNTPKVQPVVDEELWVVSISTGMYLFLINYCSENVKWVLLSSTTTKDVLAW